ncbi:right-handed parallel beta-helix repeat-containing protein, partial [Hymenobacter algoricola]|uniref:beta strand repeat-containing protein n=1 Tax=Hymenobacter algoricola TaxID=486267 RepID=UPI0031EA90D1
MKSILRLASVILCCLLLEPIQARAQSEGGAFSCDGTFYQVRQFGSAGTAVSRLYTVNRTTTTYTTGPVVGDGSGSGFGTSGSLLRVVNALSYNSSDGYMYALDYPADNGTPPAQIHLYKIGKGGIKDLGATNLPSAQYSCGTVDKNGYMFVLTRNQASTTYQNVLFRLNLNNLTTALTQHDQYTLRNAADTAPANGLFADIAFNPADGNLYGVDLPGTLTKLVINQAASKALVTTISTGTGSVSVGSAFFDVAGNLYGYSNGTTATANSGAFLQINTTTGATTTLSSLEPVTNSDGASCINPSQRIDIVKEVNSITRTTTTAGLANREFDIAFTLRVKNTSTATDDNVQVNDFLWSGVSGGVRANTTFSTTTGKVPTNVAIQVAPSVTADPGNVNPVFQLAANPTFTGIGGPVPARTAALLTGDKSLTAGQVAIITFTVRVTYAATANVPARVTNEAYASSTFSTSSNLTGYAQNTSTGFISAPDLLQAADRSTDGPTLPLVANDDTPTPSPIFFSTSISGTVFEDINYGGGAGRTQAASKGTGSEGVRVELYSLTGSFLTFTTTDAAGNYVFTTTNGTTALAASTSYQVRVVNQTIVSNRPGTTTGLLAVQTFKNGATNEVGGAEPDKTDLPANAGTVTGAGGQTLTALQTANPGKVAETITTVTTPLAAATTPAALGVDFGFNFDLVVNTNNSGQGSLRQFITNSNALLNDNLVQVSTVASVTLTEGTEYAIFMLNDGRVAGAPAGLRNGMTAPLGYSATTKIFTFTSATQPTIQDNNTAIDGKLQSNLTGEGAAPTPNNTGAEVAFSFSGANRGGLLVTGSGARIASINVSGAGTEATSRSLNTTGAVLSDGAAITFTGAGTTGGVVTDVTGQNNTVATVLLQGGATGITVSNSVLRAARSVAATGTTVAYDGAGIILSDASANTISSNSISSNSGYGINLQVSTTGTNDGNTITGNTITGNGAGTATANDNGLSIQEGNDNLVQANTITGNSGDGIMAMSGTSGNRFTQNNTGNNNGNG